jgi:hypothetical protein
MIANSVMCPKGPALLAKAGVTLDDAQWFYRHCRQAGNAGHADRAASIRGKVKAFLAGQAGSVRG